MELARIIARWRHETGPLIVQAATLHAVADELDRLQLMQARARGVLAMPAAGGETAYVNGMRNAARIILGEDDAPTAPSSEAEPN